MPVPAFYILAGAFVFIFLLSWIFRFFEEGLFKKENQYYFFLFLSTYIIAMYLLSVKALNLGDGLLLREMLALESSVLGYQLSADEILSTLVHSYLYRNVFQDPELAYRFTSLFSGFFSLSLLYYFFKKYQIPKEAFLLILSSGGMFLFFSYMENYTISTTIILSIMIWGYMGIKENKKPLHILLPIAALSSLAALFHLLSGYLLPALVFITYKVSKDLRSFLKNAFFSLITALIIILPVYIYFLCFSDTRLDLSDSHIASPPFYPLKRLVSANHIYEILSVLFFTAFVPLLIFLYTLFFRREFWKKFKTSTAEKFILLIFYGYLLHAFIHNPMLGFPADWDLMSIYWLPLSFLSVLLYKEAVITRNVVLPLTVFSLLVFFSNLYSLSERSKKDEERLQNIYQLVGDYNKKNRMLVLAHSAEQRKYFLKMDYLLYKSFKMLEKSNTPEKGKLLEENISLKNKLDSMPGQNIREWKKEYYKEFYKYYSAFLSLKLPE